MDQILMKLGRNVGMLTVLNFHKNQFSDDFIMNLWRHSGFFVAFLQKDKNLRQREIILIMFFSDCDTSDSGLIPSHSIKSQANFDQYLFALDVLSSFYLSLIFD